MRIFQAGETRIVGGVTNFYNNFCLSLSLSRAYRYLSASIRIKPSDSIREVALDILPGRR